MEFRVERLNKYSDLELQQVYSKLNPEQKKYIDAKQGIKRTESLAVRKLLSDILGFDVLGDVSFNKNNIPQKLPDGHYFSFSHSGNYIAVAVSYNPIGIDLQYHKNILPKTISRVCTPCELDYLDRIGEIDFFKIWTAKEAFVKCFNCSFAEAKKISFVSSDGLIGKIRGKNVEYFSELDYSYTVIY